MTTVLIVAKAPVAGLAKTRLSPPVSARKAARIAAAALLDTLDAVLAMTRVVPVVAMTGDLDRAERADELSAALARCTVIPQRGNGLAERLVNAHADVVPLGGPVLQIGMDTPQLTAELLGASVGRLRESGVDAVLGPAVDGGWWGLGLRWPADARVLGAVPMSRPDTGVRTDGALRRAGLAVGRLTTLSDVDSMDDAWRVARLAPGGRFAAEVRR